MATASAQRVGSANRSDGSAAHRGVVVTYALTGSHDPTSHEARTRAGIAERLARLKGFEFAGEFDRSARYAGSVYFVPSDTLDAGQAAALGVLGEDDLFGGVVAHRFVATKAITHALFDAKSTVPEGWRPEFAHAVRDSVLEGFSAFARDDARRAGEALLKRGAVRVKRTMGIGGRGQFVVESAGELVDVLASIDGQEISTSGVVVEQNLDAVTTYSVGQVRVAGHLATYCGKQRLTTNNRRLEVYGGSELLVARGDFAALSSLALTEPVRLAISQAREYDAAAHACFPGFFASRRNYDVMQGTDAGGKPRSGVLEQSWRLGGASGAEVGALEAFRANSALQAVRAVSIEIYGESPPPPEDAVVYFRGVDARVGLLTKYSRVNPDADSRRAR